MLMFSAPHTHTRIWTKRSGSAGRRDIQTRREETHLERQTHFCSVVVIETAYSVGRKRISACAVAFFSILGETLFDDFLVRKLKREGFFRDSRLFIRFTRLRGRCRWWCVHLQDFLNGGTNQHHFGFCFQSE